MKEATKRILRDYAYQDCTRPGDIMAEGGFLIEGKPGYTGIDPSKIGRYVVMLVRDPLLAYGGDPAELLARRLERPILAGKSGLFTTYSGHYKGAHISFISGGSGAPEAELALTDLMHYTRADTFIRLAGSAAINEDVHTGDIVITSGTVRGDGVSRVYVEEAFPALCSHEVILAMSQSAQALGMRWHVGVTRCSDAETVGGGRPAVDGYIQPRHLEYIDYYNRAGVLNLDRESSVIAALCTLFRRRAGAVFSIDNNIVNREKFQAGAGRDDAVEVALEGIANLYRMDRQKEQVGAPYWVPGLRAEGETNS
ncbi:MAG: nucleoside phosphorylase [Peptococcaceae bacterium]|jgi:uridine phosphorylase|nr:nucleoside phosphorylase [Peptococcaceae bacterium]